ncbi:MAG: response regulator [Bacillota bacterium]|nr:response regulator [Bacillota bacterium]
MSKKILVINDSRFERKVLGDMLIGLGHQVLTSDEDNYFAQVESFRPDVIIVNLTMSSVMGDTIIKKIKSSMPKVSCYLSSCSKVNLEGLTCTDLDGVILTPVKPSQLKNVLNDGISQGKTIAFCPYCGQKFNNGILSYTFCPFCGQNLKEIG